MEYDSDSHTEMPSHSTYTSVANGASNSRSESFDSPSDGVSVQARLPQGDSRSESVRNTVNSLNQNSSTSSSTLDYYLLVVLTVMFALGLGAVLNAIINIVDAQHAAAQVPFFSPYGEAALLVGFPLYIAVFLRVAAKEEKVTALLHSTGRRRSIQLISLLSFVALLGTLFEFFGMVFGGNSNLASRIGFVKSEAVWLNILHLLVNMIIAGVIFSYCWLKLNRKTGPK